MPKKFRCKCSCDRCSLSCRSCVSTGRRFDSIPEFLSPRLLRRGLWWSVERATAARKVQFCKIGGETSPLHSLIRIAQFSMSVNAGLQQLLEQPITRVLP
jgi:hypothetical protein